MESKNNIDKENNIYERMRNGEAIRIDDPDYHLIHSDVARAIKLTAELNASHAGFDGGRKTLRELSDYEIDETVVVLAPFYTDFGRFIKTGKNVFVNHACTFMDRGGITLEDDVMIGPKVNLITENHSLDPADRTSVASKPIVLKKKVWIGAAATILPGVTIGENSVVGAGSVVTSDVPANTVVAGVPAKQIKTLHY